MMFWFKKRAPEPEPEPRYSTGWACEDLHARSYENDGVCFFCGKPVRRAVVKVVLAPWHEFFAPCNGFVRWLDGRQD